MAVRSNSSPVSSKKPSTFVVSSTSVAIAPTAKCHSKRPQV
jgi:hypothetical protein